MFIINEDSFGVYKNTVLYSGYHIGLDEINLSDIKLYKKNIYTKNLETNYKCNNERISCVITVDFIITDYECFAKFESLNSIIIFVLNDFSRIINWQNIVAEKNKKNRYLFTYLKHLFSQYGIRLYDLEFKAGQRFLDDVIYNKF